MAQWSTRVDLTTGNRYVWHGISRVSGWVFQPSLATGVRRGRFSLEGGAVGHYELGPIAAGDLSETGFGGQHLGEHDWWGRAAFELGPARLHGGVVQYRFHGDPTRGGLSSAWNTTEVYAAVSLSSTYHNHTLEVWRDVDRVRGTFLRASTSLPVLGWPFPPFAFLYVDGDIGLNLGQGPNPNQPGLLANFAGRGVTHAGVGTALELHSGRVPAGWAAVAFGARVQLNFDDATRANGPGRNSDVIAWVWTGVTVLLGGEARELR